MGRVALIKFTGGSDLLLTVAAWNDRFQVCSCISQPRSEPPSLQFQSEFGTTLSLHIGFVGIILIHLVRS